MTSPVSPGRALSLTLLVLPGELAVVRLPPDAHVPQWAFGAAPGRLWSMTRTDEELSLVRDAEAVPSDARAERDWRALRIAGTIDFALTGILASVLAPLGDAAIGIFAISTYDTDYILVREHALAAAIDVLRAAGHDVKEP
ncbi:MAG: ACT domain-containing protein [Vicinamibacteraceae bacterium]